MTIKTFTPTGADTVKLSATAASAAVAIDPLSSVVRVYNGGANPAYLQFGDASVVSTTSKMPIPSGVTELFCKGSAPYVAAICDATLTTTLYFTAGEGM